MAVTATPSSLTQTIASYKAGTGAGNQLTHVGTVSTRPGSVATPSATAGGFFQVYYDPELNNLILDYTSTSL